MRSVGLIYYLHGDYVSVSENVRRAVLGKGKQAWQEDATHEVSLLGVDCHNHQRLRDNQEAKIPKDASRTAGVI